MGADIEAANREALERICAAQPVLVDVRYAYEVWDDLDPYTLAHAGPPLSWEKACGPMRGAIVGALRYEGVAGDEAEAVALVESGRVKLAPNHHRGAVGPMTGITSHSQPVFVVKNETFGNYAYCTINEGIGKVMRFGANDDEVLARLRWIEEELAPALKAAVASAGGINLKVIMAQALNMGDEMHQRNTAASSLFLRQVAPHLSRLGLSTERLGAIFDFLSSNDQFFLNLAMAAGKATMDPVRNIPGSTVVTAMCRNGTEFGIRVSGTGDRWFTAPVEMPEGLYFPGYSAADANPDMGDSTIVETMGLGGFAMAASLPVIRFVGAGSVADAFRITRDMGEITVGRNPSFPLAAMDFAGTPTGIDVRRVVETGILPVINTGIAHREPGIGQVGAGVVRPPLACFTKALVALGESLGLTG